MRLAIGFIHRLSPSRTAVFREITDYEHLREKFPSVFLSIRVLEKRRNQAVTEEKFSALGAVVTQRSKHTVRAPITHKVEILSGDLAGSTILESYSDDPAGGTVVRVHADLVLGGFLSLLPQFIVKPMIEENLRNVFGEVEKALASGARS